MCTSAYDEGPEGYKRHYHVHTRTQLPKSSPQSQGSNMAKYTVLKYIKMGVIVKQHRITHYYNNRLFVGNKIICHPT